MDNGDTFFESLSLIGWLGIVLWIAFAVLVFTKKEWFTSYEDRVPKLTYFDEILYEDWHFYVFMIVRFIVMLIVLFIITKIMFAIK